MTDPMHETYAIHDGEPLWSALGKTADLLEIDAEAAERQAEAILRLAPGQHQAIQILVGARRARNDAEGARAMLEAMARELPGVAAVHYELGLLLADMGEAGGAVAALRKVVALEPRHPQAWRALGDALVRTGDDAGAAEAYSQQFASSVMDLKMLEQMSTLDPGQIGVAEAMLREYLNIYPSDLTALMTLGRILLRSGQYEQAEQVFARAIGIAPAYAAARIDHLSALHQQLKWDEENRQLDLLLEQEPDNQDYRYLKASLLSGTGENAKALEFCERLLAEDPEQPKIWMAYGYALRIAGRQEACIDAFRRAVAADPELSEAWWGLANLKTFRFAPGEVETLKAQLGRKDLTMESREFLHFALGKALEDAKAYEESFAHYREGNALVRAEYPYRAEEMASGAQHEMQRYTREFFAAHAGLGNPSPEPIFILGMARSGSTLVEQILASHSAVEGCGELPHLALVVRNARLAERAGGPSVNGTAGSPFAGIDLRALGAEYLERCKASRTLGKAFFTDKLPTNFHHLGLICTILPNARIIDARRHPLACGFSNYRQIFPSKRGPSYDLADMGRYYRTYVALMAHFDRVLPGRIHRVIYEDLVRDPEAEIRRLLAYCGLPYEEQCLRFYETDRGILTASSEQVRQPLYTGSLDHWRRYEPWLGPMKDALGPVLTRYPAVPEGV
jgi:predicted Zn-dependent protease